VDFIWNDTAAPKGIGDLPFSCVPAAYAQAVSQAMDHPFCKIPLETRDIRIAGKQKQTEKGQ
jgi:CO/xanthine dehydrogenase Mo-binding subunit